MVRQSFLDVEKVLFVLFSGGQHDRIGEWTKKLIREKIHHDESFDSRDISIEKNYILSSTSSTFSLIISVRH